MEEYKEPYKPKHKDHEQSRVELPKNFKILCCPNCSTELPTENLNLDKSIGKCISCNAVFSIEEDIKDLFKSPQKIKQKIPRPEGIELFKYQNNFAAYFEQPMTLIEWPFLILFMVGFIGGIGMSAEMKSFIPFLIFTIGSTAIHYLYYLRRKAKHKIILEIDDQYLNILWRPKKLNIDKSYHVKDIDQLYVKERGDKAVWFLNMIVDEGEGQKHIKLIDFYSASKAKFMEQEIEAYLKIQDVEVPEED